MKPDIGEIIYRKRRAKKMSTRLLADFVGVSHSTINSWENNKYDIPTNKLFLLADVLGFKIKIEVANE